MGLSIYDVNYSDSLKRWLPVRHPEDPNLSPLMAENIKHDLGDQAVIGLADPRVADLRDSWLSSKNLTPDMVKEELGDQWQEVDTDGLASTREFRLEKGEDGDGSQSLICNTLTGVTFLGTTHVNSRSKFDANVSHENMWLTSDNQYRFAFFGT